MTIAKGEQISDTVLACSPPACPSTQLGTVSQAAAASPPQTDSSPPYPTTPTAELLLDSQSSLAPPRVFGNYMSVPSPRSSTTPPSTLAFAPGILPSASQKFATSPLLLRLIDCYCQRVRVFTDQGSGLRQATMNDAVRVMLSRLKHLFRLLRGTLPPRPVEDATARVCLQLRRRDRDHELFHLAGYEKPVSSDGDSPRQIHVLFLVACPGESSGHRAVAEIVARVVAQEAKGKALRVDHVAERYENDWGCWTTHQGSESFPCEPEEEHRAQRVRLGRDGLNSAIQVRDRMWADVAQIFKGEQRKAQRDFGHTLAGAVGELAGCGEVFSAYEVEVGHRTVADRSDRLPAVMVSLFTVPRETLPERAERTSALEHNDADVDGVRPTYGLPKPKASGSVAGDGKVTSGSPSLPSPKPKSLESRERVSAVIMLDAVNVRDQNEFDHIAVIYNGEWPISHVYRQDTPPPDLAGLECYVRAKGFGFPHQSG